MPYTTFLLLWVFIMWWGKWTMNIYIYQNISIAINIWRKVNSSKETENPELGHGRSVNNISHIILCQQGPDCSVGVNRAFL